MTALLFFDYIAIIYFFLVNLTYITLNCIAFFSLRRHKLTQEVTDLKKNFQSEFYKPLSIIVPAYNEEKTIVENLNSILTLQYPEFEIVVVNDGSTDKTLAQLKEEFDLIPSSRTYNQELNTAEIKEVYDSLEYSKLVVVDKENGGKADALNAGINIAHYPLVCNIDADSIIDGNALLRMVEPFVQDRRVVAAGGTVRIANNCKVEQGTITKVKLAQSWLARIQIVEYLRAFLFGRLGWAVLEGLLIISGAFGIFRRRHLVKAGGYSVDTVGEDMELVLKLNRKLNQAKKDYRVVFLPDPVCWTQVPESLSSLGRQRRRWQQGLGQSLFMNWELFFNPDYGAVGLLAFPFFFFVEFLGPVVEILGYLAMGLTIIWGGATVELVLLFFTASILMGILLSTLSLLFEELTFRKYVQAKDMLILFLTAVVENFGYRQVHMIWRLQGIFDFIRGRQHWGAQDRQRFGS